ncbi:19912_t:CDS:2 [Funneliformis geosporum]|uniref:19912_t:CDS:1 n=1 Tax=Funneliformis geosporum TaxID=1117311 RepID=A0A9W4SA95_9GLOM|nr:19912_t:CDS:2 [Funneliformis geosporum]
MDLDLRTYLQQNHHNLDWKEKIKIIYDIINALDSIHRENQIHRDLHSGNILYSKHLDLWFISDFGFCGPINKPLESIYGNLPYMAPEVISEKKHQYASDIYSIAMLMWEISFGKPPFYNHEHNYDLTMKIMNGMRPKIMSYVPLEYQNLMEQCWHFDPTKRPKIHDLLNKIREIGETYYLDENKNQSTIHQESCNHLQVNSLLNISTRSDISYFFRFGNSTRGKTGVKIPTIGLGCMGMCQCYGQSDEKTNINILNKSIELGCIFWDTADTYEENEFLLSKVLKERRNKVFLCTKFGIVGTSEGVIVGIKGDREYVRQACEKSLKRLGVEYIDLFYQHRLDHNTPIEETVTAMAELVKEGKVKYIGLSECSETILRRAHKVHPIAALQMEYSPWTLDIEKNGILEACRELGITVVAYSPLGRGFLTGKFKSIDDLEQNDVRRTSPRFMGDNFQKNLEIVKKIQEFASKKGVTASQLCLAWVLAQGDNIIAIPGTKKINHLEENINAANVQLSSEELSEIRQIINSIKISGNRCSEAVASDKFDRIEKKQLSVFSNKNHGDQEQIQNALLYVQCQFFQEKSLFGI